MYFPMFVGVLCLSFFLVYITLCPFLSCTRLEEDERAGCFALIVLRISSYRICSVTLHHGAVGWSAVCDRGISS